MKVEIYPLYDGRFEWIVILGGEDIYRDYSTRRACIRGLWRWHGHAVKEFFTAAGLAKGCAEIERAIRESRGK